MGERPSQRKIEISARIVMAMHLLVVCSAVLLVRVAANEVVCMQHLCAASSIQIASFRFYCAFFLSLDKSGHTRCLNVFDKFVLFALFAADLYAHDMLTRALSV